MDEAQGGVAGGPVAGGKSAGVDAEAKPFVCLECRAKGKHVAYKDARGLATHRRWAHGVKGKSASTKAYDKLRKRKGRRGTAKGAAAQPATLSQAVDALVKELTAQGRAAGEIAGALQRVAKVVIANRRTLLKTRKDIIEINRLMAQAEDWG